MGTDPNRNRNVSANVKHVLRFHPGPRYLPGVMTDNASRPVEGIQKVAEEFERMFPDTRLEFLGVPTSQREWLVTQLTAAQAPDVIQVNVEDVWQDTQKGWYVPLDKWLESPNPFVQPGEPGSAQWWDLFKYPTPTRGTMAPDGKMYCIALDMIETGVFYNKDVFAKLGLREPKDWVEFLAIQKTLRDNGYTPMLIDKQCLADWGVDLIFDQIYFDLRPLLDLNYDARRGEYLKGYLDWDEIIFLHGKGFFTPRDARWREVWRTLKEWRQYMAQDLTSTDLMKSFLTQKGAMYWATSMAVNKLEHDPQREFEWGIFYLPGIPQSYSRFARGREMCVIGGSGNQYSVTNSAYKDTGNAATSERLKRVVAFLQFLTTPKSCDAVVNENIAFLPNTVGVNPHAQLNPFDQFLQRHYSMSKWFFTFDLQFDEVLLRMLELYMNDGMTETEFMDWMERNLDTAATTITRRKALNFTNLQAGWDQRAALRKTFSELPDAAK